MSSINKVILVGRTGQDPELRYLPNGDAVANVSLATSEQWKDKGTGEKKETTEWHRLVFFRKLAEIVGEYVKKGGLIYVEGRLQTRKWTDKEGVERYSTEIVVDEMKMLGGRRDDDQGDAQERPARAARPTPNATRSAPPADFDDDSIPF